MAAVNCPLFGVGLLIHPFGLRPMCRYDYTTHSTVPCCKISKDIKLPDGSPANCDKKKLPTADHDRGKDYNHSTFIDLIIEGAPSRT